MLVRKCVLGLLLSFFFSLQLFEVNIVGYVCAV